PGQLALTFDISELPSPRNWAMPGGSNGYRAALVRRLLTPGLISSSPGTAGLPRFISFSIGYPELPRRPRRNQQALRRCCLRSRERSLSSSLIGPTAQTFRRGVGRAGPEGASIGAWRRW